MDPGSCLDPPHVCVRKKEGSLQVTESLSNLRTQQLNLEPN